MWPVDENRGLITSSYSCPSSLLISFEGDGEAVTTRCQIAASSLSSSPRFFLFLSRPSPAQLPNLISQIGRTFILLKTRPHFPLTSVPSSLQNTTTTIFCCPSSSSLAAMLLLSLQSSMAFTTPPVSFNLSTLYSRSLCHRPSDTFVAHNLCH